MSCIISLCDLTGHMVQPWVAAGYDAVLVDPQHPDGITREESITKVGHVINHPPTYDEIHRRVADDQVVFVAGFPPCTDVAVSGARWFDKKREREIRISRQKLR